MHVRSGKWIQACFVFSAICVSLAFPRSGFAAAELYTGGESRIWENRADPNISKAAAKIGEKCQRAIDNTVSSIRSGTQKFADAMEKVERFAENVQSIADSVGTTGTTAKNVVETCRKASKDFDHAWAKIDYWLQKLPPPGPVTGEQKQFMEKAQLEPGQQRFTVAAKLRAQYLVDQMQGPPAPPKVAPGETPLVPIAIPQQPPPEVFSGPSDAAGEAAQKAAIESP